MKRGKNYLSISQSTLEETKKLETDYFQIGYVLKVSKKDVKNGVYSDLSIELHNGELKYDDSILPNPGNGRYSKYNQNGRSIIRRDLPKISKWFSHDIYPYGDTSRTTVTASYTRKVWQREEWIPEYLKLDIILKKEDNEYYYFIVKSEEIIDKKSVDFEFRLLFNINLISENCGNYQIIENDKDEEYVLETIYVNWELLPPGQINIEKIYNNFETHSYQGRKEILERFEYIKSLNPQRMIKGTNRFNQYLGAIMENGVVVLENIHNGNAIYVFFKNWETLSKLSRTELIKMTSGDVMRICHTGNWKDLLYNTINQKTNNQPKIRALYV